MNVEKFENTLLTKIFESLSNKIVKRQRIKKDIKKLFDTMKKTKKKSTFWTKFFEQFKRSWILKCTSIIKTIKRMKRDCKTFQQWIAYVKVCDKKGNFLKKHKKDEFRMKMINAKQSNKKLFDNAKWTKDSIADTLIQTTILSLREQNEITITTRRKAEIMFQKHFSSFSTININDMKNYLYTKFVQKNETIIEKKIQRTINKTILNKISNFNDYTNKTFKQFVNVTSTQIKSFFEKCLQKEIQFNHFKRTIIIILKKFEKKIITHSHRLNQ